MFLSTDFRSSPRHVSHERLEETVPFLDFSLERTLHDLFAVQS